MPEMLDGDCGLVVNAENPKDIADAVIRLLRSDDLRVRMGERSRKRVLERYSKEASALKLRPATGKPSPLTAPENRNSRHLVVRAVACMVQISVIICTHNPRAEYLRRVLDALKAQTLPKDQWELLLIDNASKEPLGAKFDLTWHPEGRHVREEELTWPDPGPPSWHQGSWRGGFGFRGRRQRPGLRFSGRQQPDFEGLPVSRRLGRARGRGIRVAGTGVALPYLHHLAVREVTHDYWSNYYSDNRSMPFGAGLCVRKTIADAYVQALRSRPASKKLGRTGGVLLSGEDVDMALTAHDHGLGTGLFSALRTIHLIPAGAPDGGLHLPPVGRHGVFNPFAPQPTEPALPAGGRFENRQRLEDLPSLEIARAHQVPGQGGKSAACKRPGVEITSRS